MPKQSKKKRQSLLTPFSQTLDLFVDPSKEPNGFALLSATVLLGVLLAFSFVLLNSSLNSRFIGNSFVQSLSAEQIAEAGLHQAVYCLKATSGTYCGGTYGSSYAGQTSSISGGSFTTVVSGNSYLKTVTSTGTSVTGQSKRVRSDITTLPDTVALTMAAAVQAGSGGAGLSNGVIITGDADNDNQVSDSDMTSEGDITCSNNARIRGNVAVTRSGGRIDNCQITKNAYADILTSDTITLNAYYRNDPADISGSTVSGTKYPNSVTPSPVAMPNFDIDGWKALASAGTVVSDGQDYENSETDTIGPMRINGNLTMGNNVVLTLTGPLYVTGDITFGNNAVIKLDPSFGAASGVLIADGKILINNNGDFQGSGTTGSILFVVSTNTSVSDSSPAIYAQNNVSGAVLYAPYGEVHTSNNADVPAVVGLKVVMDNNTTVNKNGLNVFASPINLAASGSTVGWHIRDDTWREFK